MCGVIFLTIFLVILFFNTEDIFWKIFYGFFIVMGIITILSGGGGGNNTNPPYPPAARMPGDFPGDSHSGSFRG